jgi:hypothetical protein
MSTKDAVHHIMSEDIRDVLAHYSEVTDTREGDRKTMFYANDCNQQINVQVEGSEDEDFTNVFNVGAVQNVASGARQSQVIADFYPFMRIKATAAIAPANGTFNSWLSQLK